MAVEVDSAMPTVIAIAEHSFASVAGHAIA